MASIELIARALITQCNKILLAHKVGEVNTFLPGGHLEEREFAEAALRRELSEELANEMEIGEFIGVLEHKFTDRQGRRYEEVNMIFKVELAIERVSSAEKHLEFIWVKLGELEENNLYPTSLPQLIRDWVNKRKRFHYTQLDK
ncbi:NUDIX domain-containing protein [Candidatus Bathyarchaeota archaeon]|nr:NUDIX domain-containing protein [Candidatus Bathyarchaeota archaeon]